MKNEPNPTNRNFLSSAVIAGLGVASGLYLCFPGSVAVRAVVDLIPIAGMFDEAAAAAVLFSCLSYFGLDLTKIFGNRQKSESVADHHAAEKPVNARVVKP